VVPDAVSREGNGLFGPKFWVKKLFFTLGVPYNIMGTKGNCFPRDKWEREVVGSKLSSLQPLPIDTVGKLYESEMETD
jgi:hypothetical protein